MVLPIVVPLILLATGILKKDFKIKKTAFALGQAAILGLAISAFYKAFTGSIPPPCHMHFMWALVFRLVSTGFRNSLPALSSVR
jgi:uncharacterized membrane protein YGL010W